MIGIYVISSVGILTLSAFVIIYVIKMIKDLASVKPDGVYPEGMAVQCYCNILRIQTIDTCHFASRFLLVSIQGHAMEQQFNI